MKAFKNCPRTLSPTDIRNFLALAGYYRRFIDGFSYIASPFTTLTQYKVKVEWPEACERIFQVLNEKLTFAPMLTLPEGTKGFVVYCDSLLAGLCCILIQHGKVITYASRKLKAQEKKYPPHDLELVVVLFSLKYGGNTHMVSM